MRLASRFGHVNQIRRDRPLTHEELMSHVPSVFGSDKHESRSDRYTYIPTITILESLQREGCFVASVLTVWSAVSHSEKCGYRIKGMLSRR